MPTGPRSVSELSASGITGGEMPVDHNGRGNGDVKIVYGFSFDKRKPGGKGKGTYFVLFLIHT